MCGACAYVLENVDSEDKLYNSSRAIDFQLNDKYKSNRQGDSVLGSGVVEGTGGGGNASSGYLQKPLSSTIFKETPKFSSNNQDNIES